MALKRFKQLMCYLHFCNDENTDDTIDTDQFFKVTLSLSVTQIKKNVY